MQIVSTVGEIASAAGTLKVGEGENLSLVMSSKYPFKNETLMDHDSVFIPIDKSQVESDITSKPRTALFRERENDESMGHQIIHAKLIGNSYKVTSNSGIKFGSFSYSEMQIYMKGVHGSAATVPGKSIHTGANFHKKIEAKKRLKQYIFVGSIKIEIIGEAPG